MDNETLQNFYLLKNPIQRYAWGSKQWIQDILSLPESDRHVPIAEVWMGAHPRAPSLAVYDTFEQRLDSLIQARPAFFLGAETAEEYRTLPYLFKLLAAATPLSIQAHPNKKQAEEGFAREEMAGIPINAENRNYKDANHKPEIICAITPFTAMCGFREQDKIGALLSLLDIPQLQHCIEAIHQHDSRSAYEAFLQSLFNIPHREGLNLTKSLQDKIPVLKKKHPLYATEWELIDRFCRLYPCDSAVIAPLYLNVLSLKPGEALFLPAGVLHAYVEGFGVELMANSDNVLRGGLTPKHIDVPELLRIIRFEAFKPEILSPIETDNALRLYPSPASEFTLFRIDLTEGKPQELLPGKPTIIIVIEGSAQIDSGRETMELHKGMSLFLPASRALLTLEGSAQIFGASTGSGLQ